ncbi:MAG: UDP-N-acetylglucosamine 1-carboxyvinyltransferase [Oligoflexia bacterium]|nr:UDP-N-acetylglucosamine 1-carboxyvinyltransferase [Oligoflexia bacterium]
MDKLIITGPSQLKGKIRVSSSKNSSLPIMVATLLSENIVTINNLPKLRDVSTMLKLLKNLGAEIEEKDDGKVVFNTCKLNSYEANYEMVKTMRASFLVIGPLLARYGKASVSLPGGCAIGARSIDIHLDGLAKLGAEIDLRGGYVHASAKKLKGAEILLSFPSVGATENLMMCASLAEGTTVIKNAAREPEIIDLANFINKMGGHVYGAGTSDITIEGVKSIRTEVDYIDYNVIPDRIEASTYIIAGIITNSHIVVENVITKHMDAIFDVLKNMGANFKIISPEKNINNAHANENDIVEIFPRVEGVELKGIHVDTAPYPGFPTDVQAQLMALALSANSPSVITEHIFENRFMHVPELNRMGANILLKGNSAFIEGNTKLTAAPVMCTDLRASAALILAALVAECETEICRVYHLDRGYEFIDRKLTNLNVLVKRVPGGPF